MTSTFGRGAVANRAAPLEIRQMIPPKMASRETRFA
jgi:hypothetical protein